ncbi:MFS transporter [Curvibacter sp. RS43]|nr:MFS transporter [Curvibacter sp. RS43]MDD0809232.1 MFS transporter [Curvibacter sp. RS43]
MLAHCAGMLDLVALPVWVGTLVSAYHMDPQQAGGLATLFLVGAVFSSLAVAPRLHRLQGRLVASIGFGLAALAFAGVSLSTDYAVMAALHTLAGVASAAALSCTHGTIARSANPHRLFALVGIALGVFAVLFFAALPPLLVSLGGALLFQVFAVVMAVASVATGLAFPQAVASAGQGGSSPAGPRTALGRAVWLGALGVSCMALVQAMMFSFLERIGMDRGFGSQAVNAVLVALGLVNLLPAGLAALLQRRWPAERVVLCGPLVQAVLVLLITQSQQFAPYAAAASVFAAVMIFTHTFAFGLLAQLDPSGRALAATPAMMMAGAALGPVLGGTLVKWAGYESLAVAAVLMAGCAVLCFSQARQRPGVSPSNRA